jgi:O-antigen/teichoic acid export membrane protein
LIASIPVSLLGSVWQKVLFPIVSRLQNDKIRLEILFDKSVHLHSIFDKALYLPLFLLGNSYISFFIGDKWLPVLPSVLIFATGNILFSGYSTTTIAYLKGMGFPKVLAYWSIFQLPIAIIAISLFSNLFGFIGYAIGSQFLWLGIFYSYPILKNNINIVFLKPILYPLFSFGATYITFKYFILNHFLTEHFIFASLLILLFYFTLLIIIDYSQIKSLWLLYNNRNKV